MNKPLPELLQDYLDLLALIKKLKDREAEMNATIANLIPAAPNKDDGTTTSNIDNEFDVKIKRAYNYRFDKKELANVQDLLTDEEMACVNRNPTLSLSKYKNCEHPTLDQALIVTPAKPKIIITHVDLNTEIE